MPPGLLSIPSGVFYTKSGFGTGQAGATGTGYTNYGSVGTGTGGILPLMSSGMPSVASGVFLTKSGLDVGAAEAAGMLYTNYTSNGVPTTTGRAPLGPSVVIDAFTGDASHLHMFSGVAWGTVACCIPATI
jgi:hypothetical protein